MSISLFTEPVSVMVEPTVGDPREALLLGFDMASGHEYFVIVETDGKIVWLDARTSNLRTKWRYDTDLEDWVDLADPVVDEEDVE